MNTVTFIVFLKGERITVSTRYDESKEHEVDAAWDYVRSIYPNADYIERF